MILYLTDNPYIRKNLAGCLLLYQVYNWKVVENEDEFKIIKKFKLNENKEKLNKNKEIICIVNKSNYKLIYELSTLNKKITFYYWDTWEKRDEVFPDIKACEAEFFKYLQRGFFTRRIYNALASYNFRRIEQLLIAVSLNGEIKKDIKYIENNKIYHLFNSLLHYRPSISFAIDKLIYHSRKIDISDPFTGDFKFLKEKNSLFKLYREDLEEHPLMKFVKLSIFLNKGIMHFSDILKTLRFMEILNIVSISNNGAEVKIEISEDIFDFLDKEKWKEIYDSGDFILFNLFPILEESRIKFKCPICDFPDYKSSPANFWCANKSCNFRLNRIISPAGKAMRISQHDFLRILKHGTTVIKNKRGGYNNYFLIKNSQNNGKYNLLPQIKKNDIKPD